MIPEIRLLCEVFGNQNWNKFSQEAFIDELAASDFFEGKGSSKDKALSARDRITRAPKALGFVDLQPKIALTDSGQALINGTRPQEALLRQLLKFQLPSPYHTENKKIAGNFWVRPYLEIMRLVNEIGSVTFDEFKIFAVQLTDYRKFDDVKNAILAFRVEKESRKGKYKQLVAETWTREVEAIYSENIAAGATKTRQSADTSLKKFISTKKSNLRDYADACFRYLRYTGLFSYKGHSLIVSQGKAAEVQYILDTVERSPVFIDDIQAYKTYLFSAVTPLLYTDHRENLIDLLMRIKSYTRRELSAKTVEELKDLRDIAVLEQQTTIIREQEIQLKSYELYQEVEDTFNELMTRNNDIFDAPLFLEWNTWRAMTMLNGGNIQGNFKRDDLGQPLATAQGNMPDIECDYGDFVLSVEVTLQAGQRQYDSEGEPVTRHYARLLQKTGKETYCLFIAPTINKATLEHFFGLNQIKNITAYGGKPKIIPLDLGQFMKLIDNSYSYSNHPTPKDVREFLDTAIAQIEHAVDENDWRDRIQVCVDNWLVA